MTHPGSPLPLPTTAEVLHEYLTLRPQPSGRQTVSTFWAALEDARAASGRDRLSGRLIAAPIGSWLGAVAYLCFFDQVGDAVQKVGASAGRNSFLRCLLDFGTITSDEQEALYGLRCALAHDYSLVHQARDVAKAPSYVFTLDRSNVMRPATTPWDGITFPPPPETTTTVGLEWLANVGETVAEAVLIGFSNGSVELIKPPGETMTRFFMSYTA